MKYAYFPGCAMNGTGVEYSLSLNFLCAKIGLELREIPDWNCCGATAAHSLDNDLALALPARNLAIAEQQGWDMEVVAPCAACYARLKHTVRMARSSPEQAQRISALTGLPYQAQNGVLSLLEALDNEEARQCVAQNISRPWCGLKVACYYGCLLARPAELTGAADAENPLNMERLLSLAGAEPVEWAFKTECCGAAQQVALPRAARPLVYNILHNAQANGAEAIAAACPMCMLNLDMRQAELNKTRGAAFDMPVFYFTELLALAMGAGERQIGLYKHFYPAAALLKRRLGKEARP